MKKLCIFLLSFFAAFWVFHPITAHTSEPVLDGRVDLGSYTLFNTRVGNILDEDFKFDDVTVRAFIRLILVNHRLEPAEVDALRELSRTDVETVKFTVNSLPSTVPVADAEGRRIIGLVLKPVKMDTLWNNGLDGKRELAELHGLSVAHKNGIEKFVAKKLLPVWKKSNVNNAYDPIRKALGGAHKTHKEGLNQQDHSNACHMYHDGAAYLDAYLRDTIPDYVYSWLEAPKHTRKSD